MLGDSIMWPLLILFWDFKLLKSLLKVYGYNINIHYRHIILSIGDINLFYTTQNTIGT